MVPVRRNPLLLSVLAVALAAAASGCVRIPDSGPVQPAESGAVAPGEQGQVSVPRGPQTGETPTDLVAHFFEAMAASPMSTTVAREFLTKRAQDGWSPEDGFLTYDEKETSESPEGSGPVTVVLTGVNRFDSRGVWVGTPPGGRLEVDLDVDRQSGEWRIAALPDKLMVSDIWFEAQTVPMSLYFFDPSASILVPEPVFVPKGNQTAALLVRGLLEGAKDPDVERSFVPEGTTLNLGVTVTEAGRADISLTGDLLDELDPDTVDLMATQVAWTLRQVPTITSLRITHDGQPLALPGGVTDITVDHGASYDPTGVSARGVLYGLSAGVAVRVIDGAAEPLVGPFGSPTVGGLRSVSVDLSDSRIAGVSQDGTGVSMSTVTRADGAPPRSVVSQGVDILPPAWDAEDRLWVVDRRAGGAVVSVVRGSRIRAVSVPGISGERVIDFMVSRDGTRLVAALRGPANDRIVVSRVYDAGPGGMVTATAARPVVQSAGERLKIRGLGWQSATRVYYLKALAGRQSELRSAIVDGSPTRFDPESVSSIFTDVTRIVSSPRTDEPAYLHSTDGSYEEILVGSPRLPADLNALGYIG